MARLSIQVPNRDLDSTIAYLCRAAGAEEPFSQEKAEEFLASYVRQTIINLADRDEDAAEAETKEARRAARRTQLIQSVTADAVRTPAPQEETPQP